MFHEKMTIRQLEVIFKFWQAYVIALPNTRSTPWQYADLDELVLSGKLFNSSSRSSSPRRSPSPERGMGRDWPGDKYERDDDDYTSDVEREKKIEKIMGSAPQDAPDGSIGMGPGRTGVKGVIRDRAEAQARARGKRSQEIATLNARMERANLGGKTYLEEERERELERMMLEGIPRDGASIASKTPQRNGKPRFGHLREVGVKNFVSAVEKEDHDVWVVVHLYDSSLDRCHDLDAELSRLARLNPDTKFLRARASAVGFASSSSSISRTLPSAAGSRANLRSAPRRIMEDDEEDPYAYDEKDVPESDGDEDDGEYGRDEDVDLDVLPTLLVYRGGELVHTWVRVDWEAGQEGVEELLSKHHILRGTGAGFGNCGFLSDDEDLWVSD
ncbi:hypothetical protein ACEPAI_8552 [Sanghuangporus weigelae]